MFSAASIFYRYVLYDKDPLLVTAVRTIPALLSITTVVYLVGESSYLLHVNSRIILLGVLAGSIGMILGSYFYLNSLKSVGVSIGYPISFSYPIYVAIIANFFLNERISIWSIVALALTISGIAVISRENEKNLHSNSLKKGVACAVSASLLWALSIIVVKIALFDYAPLPFAVIRLLTATALAIPFIFVERRELRTYTWRDLLFISLGGVSGIGFGVAASHVAIDIIGASTTAIISASSPALSILLATLILHERMNKRTAIGVMMVIFGTLLTLL